MQRSEVTSLGVAALGHVLLFGALSLSWLHSAPPLMLNDPVEVQLVDDVGLHAAQPKAAVEPPASSAAPDAGISDAPPPPSTAKPTPLPPLASALTPAKPKPSHLARDLALATAAAAVTAKPKGARLADLFKDGISDKPAPGTSKTPKAATIDAKAVAGLSDAIKRQVQPCADRQLFPGPGAENIHTKLNLRLNIDGSFAAPPTMVAQTGVDDDNRRYAQRAKEEGIAAYMQCAPYHLPPELYKGGWSNINATFTPRS